MDIIEIDSVTGDMGDVSGAVHVRAHEKDYIRAFRWAGFGWGRNTRMSYVATGVVATSVATIGYAPFYYTSQSIVWSFHLFLECVCMLYVLYLHLQKFKK